MRRPQRATIGQRHRARLRAAIHALCPRSIHRERYARLNPNALGGSRAVLSRQSTVSSDFLSRLAKGRNGFQHQQNLMTKAYNIANRDGSLRQDDSAQLCLKRIFFEHAHQFGHQIDHQMQRDIILVRTTNDAAAAQFDQASEVGMRLHTQPAISLHESDPVIGHKKCGLPETGPALQQGER
jgi:hypothetical protein